MLPYFVYVLHSEKDKQFYTGFTSNLQRRHQEHMDGKSKSTAYRRPLRLIFYEAYVNKNDAIRREKYFKTTKGKRALKIMLRSTFENLS